MGVDTGARVSFRPDVLEVGPDGGHLVGSRCPTCGAHFFPARQVCSRCLSDLETVALSGRGTIYTYTVIHQGPPGFQAPYLLAYVDLPEGVRVLGQVEGPPEQARIGSEVELVLVPQGQDQEGREVVGFRFRPTGG